MVLVTEPKIKASIAGLPTGPVRTTTAGTTSNAATSPLEDMTEPLIAWSQTRFGNDEIIRAKEEFFLATGKFFAEDPFYDERMTYFLDTFIFARPIPVNTDSGTDTLTPYQAFMLAASRSDLGIDATKFADLTELGSFKHSLYQVSKHSADAMQVKDILTGVKYTVHPQGRATFVAFKKKDIFQGFLFSVGEKMVVSFGVVHHPSTVTGFILKHIKKALKAAKSGDAVDKTETLNRLAYLHLKHMRHKHVKALKVYEGI